MPALWMTASMRPILLTCSARARVSDASARSPMTTPAARGAMSANADARCFERACRTTWCPSFISVIAAARPRPSVDPVMNTRRMERSFFSAERERNEVAGAASMIASRRRRRREFEGFMPADYRSPADAPASANDSRLTDAFAGQCRPRTSRLPNSQLQDHHHARIQRQEAARTGRVRCAAPYTRRLYDSQFHTAFLAFVGACRGRRLRDITCPRPDSRANHAARRFHHRGAGLLARVSLEPASDRGI